METLTGAKEAGGGGKKTSCFSQISHSLSSGMLEATKDGTLAFTSTIMGTEHSEWIISRMLVPVMKLGSNHMALMTSRTLLSSTLCL